MIPFPNKLVISTIKHFLVVSMIAGALLCPACAASKEKLYREGSGALAVKLVGFRNNHGEATISLFNNPKGFPRNDLFALESKTVPIVDQAAHVTFTHLPYGTYALSALHDENLDGQMATSWAGSPDEGFGFSGHPDYKFGPPDYASSSIFLTTPEREIVIRIKYGTSRLQHQQKLRKRNVKTEMD
jgi:uncharacterized protein (DUF2141 family)